MNNKKLALSIGIILLFVGTFYFFTKNKPITNYPPKNQTVVAFGDSLIEGVGSLDGGDFVSLLENDLNIQIINKGVSGDTTASALKRIDDVLALDPGITIILLGGNDVLRRTPKTETFQNLEKIIEKLQQNDSIVLLLGVRGGILFDGYENDYKNLSKKYNTAYVSNILDGLITKKEYMRDGIHPNDKGYKIIAERVGPVLGKLLK